MSLRFNCACGKELAVADHLAGKKARCPDCQAIVSVPSSLPSPTVAAPNQSDIRWFYANNGQAIGPVDEAAMRQMAQSGRLTAHDTVWREGSATSQPASVVFPAWFAAADPSTPMYIPPKTKTAYFLFCMFLGWAGAHSFYIGRTGKGVAQLLIFLFGSLLYGAGAVVVAVWIFIDELNLVNDRTVDYLGRPLVNAPKKKK